MAKVDRKVRDLVDMVERGELRLPEMQRGYVWRATRVRDLFDSLYRGYPSGVILAWESDEPVAMRDFAVSATTTAHVRPLLLLDGQQRLTSLAAVLRGEPVTVRGRRRPIEVLFNLDHPEELTLVTEVNEKADDDDDLAGDETAVDIQERLRRLTFVIGTRALESLPNWVRVSDIFKLDAFEILEEKGFDLGSMEREQRTKYTKRLQAVRAIENYEYRMDVLERSKSYTEVTEIFVRVNSLGAKLRSSDLALAQITAKWRGSLDEFTQYQGELARRGFELEIGIILRALISIASGQSKFVAVNSLTKADLQSAWVRTMKALDFAVNAARTNLGIDSPILLSSPYMLIAAAYWADKLDYRIDTEASDGFRKWFLLANAKGRYSRGSSETLLDQDLTVMRNGGSHVDLLARLKQQVGRLGFTADELVGRSSRSGAFKTIFLAFRQDRARDWATNLEISPKHSGKSDVIEYHHVFPKAFLRDARPDVDRQAVDDLANLAFIGAATNKRVSNRAPSNYRSDFDAMHFAAQEIAFENGLDQPENFEKFIAARRAALAARLNTFLQIDEHSE